MDNQNKPKPNDISGLHVEGHIKIFDRDTKDVLIDQRNAIHYENISIALAQSMSNAGQGWIYQMSFGNGGTTVDPTGLISYLTPNSIGINTGLYNETFSKVVDQQSFENTDPTNNNMSVRHISGATYTDIVITCLLDYGEPTGQDAFDNTTDMNSSFVFDELGLRSYNPQGTGKLLTHVIFTPTPKALNRAIQVDYTIRIQSLTGFTEV